MSRGRPANAYRALDRRGPAGPYSRSADCRHYDCADRLVPQHGAREDHRHRGRRERADASRSAPFNSIGPTCGPRSPTSCCTGWNPPPRPPLFRADLLQVDLKLLSPFRGFVDIAYLLAEKPQANIIVTADGKTNVPLPKVPGKGDKTALEDHRRSGHWKVRSAQWRRAFGDRKQPGCHRRKPARATRLQYGDFAVHRRNRCEPALRQQTARRREIARDPGEGHDCVHQRQPAHAEVARSRLRARWSTSHAPRTNAHVVASVALEEVSQVAALGLTLDTAHGPAVVKADVTGSMENSLREHH